jgi:hypothetical protein
MDRSGVGMNNDFMTPGESRRFWVTLGLFLTADLLLIAFVLWAL